MVIWGGDHESSLENVQLIFGAKLWHFRAAWFGAAAAAGNVQETKYFSNCYSNYISTTPPDDSKHALFTRHPTHST